MTAARNTSTNADIAPRVFLSYARSDGEQFAARLRKRLEAKHIPLWQDRIGMEGGRDWWQQIKDALDVVEFMVLVMTPWPCGRRWYAKSGDMRGNKGCASIQSKVRLILTSTVCRTGCAARISTTSTMNGSSWSTI